MPPKSTARLTSRSIIWTIRISVAVFIVVVIVAVGVGVRVRHTKRKTIPTIHMQPSTVTFTVTHMADPTVSTSPAPPSHLTTNATSTASLTLSPPTHTYSFPPTHTSTPSTASPAYATGRCSYHLQEWQNCQPPNDLSAVIRLLDNDGHDIGDSAINPSDPNKTQIGEPINDGHPYYFISKLPHPLVIVGEHMNDYVQFYYGDLEWRSTTTTGNATCSNGGWWPVDGPVCSIESWQFAVCHTIPSQHLNCFAKSLLF